MTLKKGQENREYIECLIGLTKIGPDVRDAIIEYLVEGTSQVELGIKHKVLQKTLSLRLKRLREIDQQVRSAARILGEGHTAAWLVEHENGDTELLPASNDTLPQKGAFITPLSAGKRIKTEDN